MRQKIFWFDLAVCSLWMLAALADKIWKAWPTHFLIFTLVTVMMRIILSFALYRKEKRSWFPLSLFMVLFALLVVGGPIMSSTYKFAILSFAVMGIKNDHLTLHITQCGLLAWLILGPCIAYVVELCKKTLTASNLTWKDSMGAILWKDRKARAYCQLMLVAVCALYAGLAMEMRLCQFGCLVLPPLSYYILTRYTNAVKRPSEGSQEAWKSGLMVIGMAVFFYAQLYAGMWRIWMLVASISLVTYVCWQTFGKQGLAGRSILVSLYLGIILPSLAIGYNQYACLEYSRWEFYTLEPFRGIFYIEDPKTEKRGLRDRYGLLVEPVYEGIALNYNNRKWGIYELRNNGCYTLYNLYRNQIIMTDENNRKDSTH